MTNTASTALTDDGDESPSAVAAPAPLYFSEAETQALLTEELALAAAEQAELFCNVRDQSRTLGEFKHTPEAAVITPLGEVLLGTSPGRQGERSITVFDSSGFRLQDLYLGLAIMEKKELVL